MKNKKVLFLFFVLFFAMQFSAFAQNEIAFSLKISGQVLDSLTNAPIGFVTAKVVEKENAKLLKAVAANEKGQFSLTLNKAGDFLLVTEFIGKKTKSVGFSVDITQNAIDLGKILMDNESMQLSEVEIVATKPLVKMDIDKIIYDMQADPESQTNNALEMLRKVPMVTVDGEDKIELKGSSNFKIYMNGKPSNMITNNPGEVLKSMPASSIKNIEVITEPGAKYDAEGIGGIINIVTNKTMVGYSGSVQASADNRGGYGGGGYFSTKIGKFGVTANLNARKNVNGKTFSTSSQENLDSAVVNNSYRFMNQQSSSDNSHSNFMYGNIELSYEIDSLNLISAAVGGMGGGNTSSGTKGKTFMLKELGDTVSGYETLSNSTRNWGGINANIDYQRSFKKPDRLLTISYLFDNSPNSSENKSIIRNLQAYPNTFNPKNTDRILTSDGKTDEHTFQVDYVEPFSKKHVVEGGLKYILRLNNSDNDYLIRDTLPPNEYITDNSQKDNDLKYTQYILGVYASYTFKLEKFSVRGGLRYERTESKVEYPNSAEQNFTAKPFSNFIPSIIATYKLNNSSNLRLTYNQSVSRPGIWYLNPFVNDTDPFNISQGNPDLEPEISNTFSLGYSMFTPKFNLNANLGTSFVNNSIESVTSMDTTRLKKYAIYTTYENIGHANLTYGSLYVNWTPSTAFRIYGSGSINYNYYFYDNGIEHIKKDGIRYAFSGGTQVTLPWKIRINANAGYYSPNIRIEGKGSAFYYHSFSLGKDFLDKKLSVNLRISEPFRENRKYESSTLKKGVYQSHSTYSSNARNFSINVSYRFGEMKEQIKKVERGISNDDVKSGGSSGESGSGE